MRSKFKFIHERQLLIGTHMTAAGRHPLDMRDNVLDIIASRHNPEQIQVVNPVKPGPALVKRERVSIT